MLLLDKQYRRAYNQEKQKELMMKFRIRELARERELKTEDLAIKSGVKYSTVKNLWQGRTLDPSYSTLRALARALNVTVEQLEDLTHS